MQLTGLACRSCGTKIVADRDARSCRRCEGAFHARCLAGSETCPACGALFSAAAEEERAREEERRREDLASGRSLLLALFVLLLFSNLLIIGISFAVDPGAGPGNGG